MTRTVQAGKFKAECLRLMDEVEETMEPIVITKHGKPVAQLVPIPGPEKKLFGWMEGTVRIKGDVIAPVNEEWDADH